MSQILQSILEPRIRSVVEGFGTAEYTGPTDPSAAQDRFVRQLSEAISTSVNQYIIRNIKLQVGTPTVGGPSAQATVAPGNLIELPG